MVIYGVLILSLCYFAGMFLGQITGIIAGLNSNVGGVGFAMIFLLLLSNYTSLFKDKGDNRQMQDGIAFWQNMYIPVVIAMAASQDVVRAISSGGLAILCGIVVTVLSLLMIPILNKLSFVENKAPRGPRHDYDC